MEERKDRGLFRKTNKVAAQTSIIGIREEDKSEWWTNGGVTDD